ncbi:MULTISPECIES: NADP-dependent oxidoreductase [Actinosynnema]|uniref:NADP-dependent oxidoreductase n=1 Tax=Actinosynnema TaxID=40566 RepID=UPI0020A2EC6F|nr:NADP-dependent oxidoreductase [Actinosynnema pretiosum]
MRAIGVHRFGGPEELRLLDLPEPQAGPGEVRIRVHAAAVNPTDVLLRTGGHAVRMLNASPPHVPGMDAAGVVDQVGPGVHRLAVGQPVVALVLFTTPQGGAYADHVVVPEASVVPAPEGVDLMAASTLLMNAMTARMALDELALPRGATVAVTGAAGAVGGYAVELAHADGLQVIADAAEQDAALVRSFGADHVVQRGKDVANHIRALHPQGVPGLIDASAQTAELLPALADNGTLIELRGWSAPAERGIKVHPVMVPNRMTDTKTLTALSQAASEGHLTLRVAKVLPAEQAAEAHRLLEAGALRGRLVLDFT